MYYYLKLDSPLSHWDYDMSKDYPVYYKNSDEITPETALLPVAHPYNFLY